jgi:uncharacterized protein YecT (DUF1311 family)
MRMTRPLSVLFLIAALAVGTARAASFDCAKAATPVEKSVCADPGLGALDEQIAQAYAELLRTLDEPQKRHARQYQLGWLRGRAVDGLGPAMKARLDELRGARQEINGVTLLFLGGHDRPAFVAQGGPAGSASYNAWAEGRWLEADKDDREALRVHALRDKCRSGGAARPAEDDCEGDAISHRFEVEFVSPQLISVQEDTSEDAGGVHPMNETSHYRAWLSHGGELKPADLFADARYKAVIARHVAEFMTQVAGRDDKGGYPAQTAVACEPANWGLHREGLHVTAQGYDFEVGRGFVEFDVPWAEFGKSLRPAILQAVQP